MIGQPQTSIDAKIREDFKDFERTADRELIARLFVESTKNLTVTTQTRALCLEAAVRLQELI